MYRIFNISLDSQIPVPELSQASDSTDTETFTFSLNDQDKSVNPAARVNWFHDWLDPNGNVSISAGHCGSNYWLRFPGMVDFKINLNQQNITAYKHSSTPDTTVRHMLLDQVIPRILGQQCHLILHAGAVTLGNGKTVAFIGQSGWGKSTLVSSFQQQGAELITDDCLMIEFENGRVTAIPNYYGIRLFDDSINAIYGQQQDSDDVAHYSSKRRLIMTDSSMNEAATSLQLDAIFLLSDPDAVSKSDEINITAAGGIDAMMALVAQTFVLDVTDKQLMVKQFKHCGRLFDNEVLCFQLDYPRKHSRLDDVRNAIENALEYSAR